MRKQRTLHLSLLFLVTSALCNGWSAAANPSETQTGTQPNTEWRASFADATCNKLVAIPISFLIPGGYVTRSPGQGTGTGCLWGAPADLDDVTAEAGSLDFSRIVHGVFWARATGSVGYLGGHFVSGPNKSERSEREALERAGAKIIRYGRVGGAPKPAQEIVAEYTGKRVYMLYLAMGIDTNTLLINYHPPAAEPLLDSERHWQEFLAGISAASATAVSATEASSIPPAVRAEPPAGAFWETARISDAFSAFRQKLSGQAKVVEFELFKDQMILLVQEPGAPMNVDSYTYRDGKLTGPKPERWDDYDTKNYRPFDLSSAEGVAKTVIPSAIAKALARLQLEGGVPSLIQITWWSSDRLATLRVYIDGARKDGTVDFDTSGKFLSSYTR